MKTKKKKKSSMEKMHEYDWKCCENLIAKYLNVV